VEVAEELARACPGVRVIGLTRHTDPAFMMKMLGAGARGYVLKQSSSVELVTAVRTVVSGAQYIDSSVHLPPAQPAPPASDAGEGEPLTDREAEVLRFTASSLTARQIAQQMTLDIDDVLALKRTAMRKARLLTRIDIIDYARAKGWLA
jgi:DNA-binding NarL/FixJ family response regulator